MEQPNTHLVPAAVVGRYGRTLHVTSAKRQGRGISIKQLRSSSRS